jgi:hypothetical protein
MSATLSYTDVEVQPFNAVMRLTERSQNYVNLRRSLFLDVQG